MNTTAINTMTKTDTEMLVKILEALDRIKMYGIKVAAYNGGYFEDGVEPATLCMPNPADFLAGKEIKTLFDLLAVVNAYLTLIPEKELLEEMEYETAKSIKHGNAFYNEIPAYEASGFFGVLRAVIRPYKGEKFCVDLYGLSEISIGFETKEDAMAFINFYCSPCTLFKLEDNRAIEIDCF